MSAAEILKLIESVDPTNTAKLDEIDARVWCWLRKDEEFKQFEGSWIRCQSGMKYLRPLNSSEYTRSRDALKAIRPEGWNLCSQMIGSDFAVFKGWFFAAYGEGVKFVSASCKTEELAELHAIIQAIDYERTQKSVDK